jgi:hypothetical protein
MKMQDQDEELTTNNRSMKGIDRLSVVSVRRHAPHCREAGSGKPDISPLPD